MKSLYLAIQFTDFLESIETHFPDGGLCHVTGNHDFTRLKSRLFDESTPPEVVVPYVKFLSGMPGPYMHYYGDELGLPQANVIPRDREPDPAHRDGCRAPMPWNSDNRNGGFSDAEPDQLYFSYPKSYDQYAVNRQENEDTSTLNQIREVFKERNENTVLRNGDFVVLDALEKPLVGYARSNDEQAVAFILNTSDQPVYSQIMGTEIMPYECNVVELDSSQENDTALAFVHESWIR